MRHFFLCLSLSITGLSLSADKAYGLPGTVIDSSKIHADKASAEKNMQNIQKSTADSLEDKISAIVMPQLTQSGIPGYSMMVVKDGKIIYDLSYGYADVTTNQPVNRDTIFGIGSLTKGFTALALLHLVDEGKVKLSDPLDKYLDGLPESWKHVTIYQLATMTGGMRHGTILEKPWSEELKHLESMPLANPPGTSYLFSNPSYRLLGSVIEKVAGQTYLEYLHQSVLDPLSLTNTDSTDKLARTGRLAIPYGNGQKPLAYKEARVSFAAGMLGSTTSDLAKYAQAIMTKRLLSHESTNLLWYNRDDLPSPGYFAFGWLSKTEYVKGEALNSVFMNGSSPGITSTIFIVPESHLTVVALCNIQSKQVTSLPSQVAQLVLGKPIEASEIGDEQ